MKKSDGRTCISFAEQSRSSKVTNFLVSWIEKYPIGQSAMRKKTAESEEELKKLNYNSGWINGKCDHLLLVVPGVGEQGESWWKKQGYY